MLNGAKKTTFDIARISTSKGNVSKILTATISLHRIFLSTTIDTTSTYRHFFHLPFPPTPNPRTSLPFVTHTHTVVSKNNVFFYAPPPFFFSPCKQKLLIQSFFFSNEILHKLTSCHFIFQNKNVERFIPKNTSLFTSSSTIVQFIREQ